jgi:hypothetical protein
MLFHQVSPAFWNHCILGIGRYDGRESVSVTVFCFGFDDRQKAQLKLVVLDDPLTAIIRQNVNERGKWIIAHIGQVLVPSRRR